MSAVLDRSDPAWYRACTLRERLPAPAGVPAEDEVLTRRVGRWLAEPVFGGDDGRFAERLARDDLSEVDIRSLLAEPPHALRDRHPRCPEWLADLADAYDRPAGNRRLLDRLVQDDASLMLYAVEPVIEAAAARLRPLLDALGDVLDPDAVEESLLRGLCGQLMARLTRTVILELHVASVEGRLPAEQRFRAFAEGLRERDRSIALMREYPVLARDVMTAARHWADAAIELLGRFAADRAELVATFFAGADPGPLTIVDSGAGDVHRRGRSVAMLGFEHGARLVYKPRSLAIDVHFQQLLAWCNDRGAAHPFRVLTVVDKKNYGWVEFVPSRPCGSRDQVERFFHRQGAFLAILHCLCATDFHYENIIADGEHPVLVDIEALFHPTGELLSGTTEPRDSRASVLATGLLPQRRHDETGDFSGLSSGEGRRSTGAVPTVEAAGTDQMRIVHRSVEIPAGDNVARLGGATADAADHVEQVVDGFTRMCEVITAHRAELLAEDGPLARFGGDEVRCVLRATQTYGSMLIETTHPDLLRDGLARDRFLDNLWTSAADNPALHAVFHCERRDLERGDVPVFVTRPGSRDLWCADGHRHAGLLAAPVLDLALGRVRSLDVSQVRRQTWIIRASFAAMTLGEGKEDWPRRAPRERPRPASRAELVAAAARVGEHLSDLKLGDTTWLGLTADERGWSLRELTGELYDGLAGLALFFAYLGHVTGEQSHTKTAESVLDAVRREHGAPGVGAFDGEAGTVYLLTHLGALWQRADLLDEAEALALRLAERATGFDIINGLAGLLCVLLGLHEVRPSLLDAAVRAGDRLLELAEPQEVGIGWRDERDRAPLAGFSHGASGVAHALLRLFRATGDDRYLHAAEQAFAYERAVFSPSEANWPDLRAAAEASFMTAWCHGAPGIGLARAHALDVLSTPEVRAELDVAVATTIAGGLDLNHSLCHGSLGNLELLLHTAHVLGDNALLERAYRIAGGVLDDLADNGWACGVPGGAETPGLMNGLAGIGLGLLRLGAPKQVPAVLTLCPPLL
ncbi:type 2 lanthipeptide synthetase LanM family protein [Allokutzneria sp. A3M-2-11 16]|uniref:type 2 lanthipeptide synthetase LanM family protein n=1 Tax=Allokutzneria sp. A3M-2-11 16 TaxID=2962043 RepID=UPI0020B85AB9|nr:type 2 lanthipeptide synthetase LanM family protein [Allokutzneria sp. A3M-2-11 16]MCP3801898.1 type 2 lanthipeptide synthetase LanM family protein [Allokutzneria sp. A3M-2-11 16]